MLKSVYSELIDVVHYCFKDSDFIFVPCYVNDEEVKNNKNPILKKKEAYFFTVLHSEKSLDLYYNMSHDAPLMMAFFKCLNKVEKFEINSEAVNGLKTIDLLASLPDFPTS